jgi:hypothetical protein
VAIDASGMLQSFTGEPADKVGDTLQRSASSSEQSDKGLKA